MIVMHFVFIDAVSLAYFISQTCFLCNGSNSEIILECE